MGNSRIYSVNEDEMNRLASELGRAISKNSDASSTMSRNFSRANEGGLMGNTISALSKNMEKVSSIGTNIRSSIIKQTGATFEIEHNLTSKIEEIDVPQDFVKNDTRKYNSIEDIQLSKKDDKSVNEGQETEKVNEIDDNSIQKDEQLYNLTKEETKQVDEIADNSIKDEEKLYNLTGEQSKEFNEIADNSIKDEEKLKDITGEEAKENEEVVIDAIQSEKQLKEVKTQGTEQVEIQQGSTTSTGLNLSSMGGGGSPSPSPTTSEESGNATGVNLTSSNNQTQNEKEKEEIKLNAVQSEEQLKEVKTQETEQVTFNPGSTASPGFNLNSMGNSGTPTPSAAISEEENVPGFNFTSSNVQVQETKEKEKKENTIDEMIANLSTYQNMERINAESEKQVTQQENNNV